MDLGREFVEFRDGSLPDVAAFLSGFWAAAHHGGSAANLKDLAVHQEQAQIAADRLLSQDEALAQDCLDHLLDVRVGLPF